MPAVCEAEARGSQVQGHSWQLNEILSQNFEKRIGDVAQR